MGDVLARFCYPSAEICAHGLLYLRLTGEATHTLGSNEVRVASGAVVSFASYFNALPLNKWRRHTNVRHVSVAFDASGAVRAEVVHGDAGTSRVIATEDFETPAMTTCVVDLPTLDETAQGAVFLRVSALGEGGVVRGGEWRTSDPAVRRAHVGVVITTYGHEVQVSENTRRLRDAVASAGYQDRVDVIVVDNRNGGGLEVGTEVTVIPNRNLGGAGGFTRGLMHLRGTGTATHCLFMDDDVWFEPDVVLRALALLSHANAESLCLAGAMLSDTKPTIQYEAGSTFRAKAVYPNRPLGSNLDLEDWGDVLAVNVEAQPIDYGAWWFFAFPLALTNDYPLPMFVRGDDVAWGMLHAGPHTIAMSGIAVWHLDFETKNSPTSWFYDTRNYALVSVLSVPGYGVRHLLVRYVNVCARSLLSLKYASAELITFGLREFFEGPQHWMKLDQPALHELVRSMDDEKAEPLDAALEAAPDLPTPNGVGKALMLVRSLALLGGHVLPERWLNDDLGAVRMQHRALAVATRRRALLYRDASGRFGFVARRDRRRFFTLSADMIRVCGLIVRRLRSTSREYRIAYPEMVSDGYWRDQFGMSSS